MTKHSARIRFPDVYALHEYRAAIRGLERVLEREPNTIVLDFSKTERAYPDGVLPLIGTLHRLRRQSSFSVEVQLPASDNLRGVFNGVDWSGYLSSEDDSFHDLPPSTPQFLPVRPFHDANELQRLHESIVEVLVEQAPLATYLPEAIWWVLSEVMENVLNHALSGVGWVQASTFRDRGHINILVVDAGIGIQESLSSAFPRLSDTEAVKKAVEEGVTRDESVGAGYGLTGCRRIVELNAGRMVVFSGTALFTQDTRLYWSGPKTIRHYVRQEVRHVGTIVELQLRIDRKVDLSTALPSGPVIPLVEVTHGAEGQVEFDVKDQALNLSTRDAGRKLRNKVMNLTGQLEGERTVLDFSRVEMLSSSFADEFLGRMAQRVGRETFWQRFELRGMNKTVGTVVWAALRNRLAGLV